MMHGAAPVEETLSSYLAWDHAQIESMLADARTLVDEDELERADDLVREIRARLLRHIRLEEQIVFPLLERRTGRFSGPTVVMRHEHVRIQGELGDMAEALARGDVRGYLAAKERFEGLMPSHMHNEERFVFPAADRALGDRQRRELVSRLREA